jgi:hypothetical protein
MGNYNGQSLVSTLVAVAITGVLISTLSGALVRGYNGQKRIDTKAQIGDLSRELTMVLSDPNLCKTAFFTGPADPANYTPSKKIVPLDRVKMGDSDVVRTQQRVGSSLVKKISLNALNVPSKTENIGGISQRTDYASLEIELSNQVGQNIGALPGAISLTLGIVTNASTGQIISCGLGAASAGTQPPPLPSDFKDFCAAMSGFTWNEVAKTCTPPAGPILTGGAATTVLDKPVRVLWAETYGASPSSLARGKWHTISFDGIAGLSLPPGVQEVHLRVGCFETNLFIKPSFVDAPDVPARDGNWFGALHNPEFAVCASGNDGSQVNVISVPIRADRSFSFEYSRTDPGTYGFWVTVTGLHSWPKHRHNGRSD